MTLSYHDGLLYYVSLKIRMVELVQVTNNIQNVFLRQNVREYEKQQDHTELVVYSLTEHQNGLGSF